MKQNRTMANPRCAVRTTGSDRLRRAGVGVGTAISAILVVSGLIAGLTASQRAEAQEPGAADMVLIRGGEFWYGCNETVDSECDDDEKPGRRVENAEFWIDRTEVTVEAYRPCVVSGSCPAQGLDMPFWKLEERPSWAWACNWGKEGRENHPVNCTTWDQARSYCEWAGKSLPTEEEWERAARGTDGRRYPWGNEEYAKAGPVANIADQTLNREKRRWPMAQGYDDGFYVTAPVGSYPTGASPEGVVDMVGNVWEWTSDWYSSDHRFRVVRGGSWANGPRLARASNRYLFDPTNRGETFGFRCVQRVGRVGLKQPDLTKTSNE